MIDKDILDGLSELDEADLKRIKLLVDNKLKIESDVKVSYRTKSIKCGKESCNSCPHGPYWYCLLYTSPSPRDLSTSRMPSSA